MSIDVIIADYIRAKQEKAAAEKREKLLKEQILLYANNSTSFETEDYTVIVKTTMRVNLDTTSLYKDFPDIKETYGRETSSVSLAIAENSSTKKTA